MKEFLPVATQVARLINEHTGLEVAHVVPVKRIPKTTSGKIQRHLLEESYVQRRVRRGAGGAAQRCARRSDAAGGARHAARDRATSSRTSATPRSNGKRIDVHDNLFEIGASSLKLIEIHEQHRPRVSRAWWTSPSCSISRRSRSSRSTWKQARGPIRSAGPRVLAPQC